MNAPLTEQQLTEFQTILTETKDGLSKIKDLPGFLASLQTENETMRKDLTEVRRMFVTRHLSATPRLPGFVTDECARHFTGIALAARLRSGKHVDNAPYLQGLAKDILGIEIKTA